MPFQLFRTSESEKTAAVEKLISASAPRPEFFLMVVLSVVVAVLGILIDNVPVVIGSMLIAPLLSPVLSFALGVVIGDFSLIVRSGAILLRSLLFALIAGVFVSFLFGGLGAPALLLASAEPSVAFLIISVVAGVAASFAFIKEQLSVTLPGIAIAVALIPPLAVTGTALAGLQMAIVSRASLLFLVNMMGIIFGSMVVFALANFHTKKDLTTREVKKEEKTLERENGKK
ncbi:MAG: TIGR00341 family protein [Candidatus Jorgensenbacteria bacterium]|nr:TIGR00341 family protein [Candidatus Jorgensenbacteria bacterium]